MADLVGVDASSRQEQQPRAANGAPEPVTVPIASLRAGDSPRLTGTSEAHVARLAETETPLPPILVDRRTKCVVDGMHRLLAASRQGRETIEVVFFHGSEQDLFLRAVQENVQHGLPLSQVERQAAARRLIQTHPHLSDRALAHSAGIAAKTVAAIRRNLGENIGTAPVRVGSDGRTRPLDAGEGRLRAAELLLRQPHISLRDIAKAAGISPATVLDVRQRIERGDAPVPEKAATARRPAVRRNREKRAAEAATPRPGPGAPYGPEVALNVLRRDPSLRNTEHGRAILRLLHLNAAASARLPDLVGAMPPHCVTAVVRLALGYAEMWTGIARRLDSLA
ncbi:transcriptional regulator [Amycolatopsis acidiphila]|uniref:Transcriptional regulator n=3 Tax=Amycolatopsis acidiphila TaxID=715473 RepID=A0A557ZX79_9PSEU|nr:transcriptional regulator [Amycolatopsis acidiphila]